MQPAAKATVAHHRIGLPAVGIKFGHGPAVELADPLGPLQLVAGPFVQGCLTEVALHAQPFDTWELAAVMGLAQEGHIVSFGS
jgi:hypothetical protein